MVPDSVRQRKILLTLVLGLSLFGMSVYSFLTTALKEHSIGFGGLAYTNEVYNNAICALDESEELSSEYESHSTVFVSCAGFLE